MKTASPLRYPGGKWRVANFFSELIALNTERPPTYVEPYAGGASLALSLLLQNQVREVYLNDIDPGVYAFWKAILTRNHAFREKVATTPITPVEWRRQRGIYASGTAAGFFALGFATFFLNRTNHSGILNGGMIGGKDQTGTFKIDARFNREDLQKRIKRIGEMKERIHLSRLDALAFLRCHRFPKNTLIYLDPPYFQAGRALYLNAYQPADHAEVQAYVAQLKRPWVVSYDDVPQIRTLYRNGRSRRLELLHTARAAHPGHEVLFFAPELRIPPHAFSQRT